MCKLTLELNDAKLQRPPKTGQYIAVCAEHDTIVNIYVLDYSATWDKFNCQDYYTFDQMMSTSFEPSYWCELPTLYSEVEHNGN